MTKNRLTARGTGTGTVTTEAPSRRGSIRICEEERDELAAMERRAQRAIKANEAREVRLENQELRGEMWERGA